MDARRADGDDSVSIGALARRAEIGETVVRRMLAGEVRLGLDDLLKFGSIGHELIEWALRQARLEAYLKRKSEETP